MTAKLPTMTISATTIRFDDDKMWLDLTDGRTLGVPLAWFPRLLNASPAQRTKVEISRTGLHWEDLNEDISIDGLIAGRQSIHKCDYEPTPAELAGIDRGLGDANAERFASESEVDTAFAKFRGV